MKLIICLLILAFFTLQTYSQDDGRLIKIPVIFHVLYGDKWQDNGINCDSRIKGNSTMYLPKEKIEAELADLNADFQNLNTDLSEVISEYKSVIGNPKIQFYLFDIKYKEINKREIESYSNNTDFLVSKSRIENPSKFLNVYISKVKVDGEFTNGVTPAKSSKKYGDSYNAVILNYEWVGLRYRLLTHETGHWLGLPHTWDDAQLEDEIDDGVNDKIDDIPLQESSTDVDCVKCPPQIDDRISLKFRKKGFVLSNYNNFMDYSGCRYMFSIKQARLMRKVIKFYRPEIWVNRE